LAKVQREEKTVTILSKRLEVRETPGKGRVNLGVNGGKFCCRNLRATNIE